MSNPILRGVNPDPSIVRVGKDYFLATSTFEYFPGVPIYHSTDLIDWRLIGHALNRRTQLDLQSIDDGGGVWAPTIRHSRGKFYLAVCIVYARSKKPIQPQGFYVCTADIWNEAAWSDPTFFDMLGIDQDLFFDDDGRVFLSTARFCDNPTGIPGRSLYTYGCEIDLVTGSSLHEPVLLKVQGDGVNTVAEGPHIIKKDGWYYLFTAEGGTGDGHSVVVCRSRNPLGPYDDPPVGVNPLVQHTAKDSYVRRTGHADVAQSEDGSWWAVLLGVRPQPGGTFHLGRETFLVPVRWPQGGWPEFNESQSIGPKVRGNIVRATVGDNHKRLTWKDTFDKGLLPGWYFLRTPVKPFHSFPKGETGITLRSNGQVIHRENSPSMLLRKQPLYSCTWSTRLAFEPSYPGEEAGVVVYYNFRSFASLSIRSNGHEKRIYLSWYDMESQSLQVQVGPVIPTGSVKLSIAARPDFFTFEYAVAEERMNTVGCLPATILDGGSVQEKAFYFVGSHFGIFVQAGEGEARRTPARFESVEMAEDL